MELLVFILNDSDTLEKIMVEFANMGIKGSTIIDSVGMANVLSSCEESSLFSSLSMLMNKGRTSNYTVLTVLRKEKVNKALEIINDVTGGLDKAGTGIAFTVPLGQVIGGSFN